MAGVKKYNGESVISPLTLVLSLLSCSSVHLLSSPSVRIKESWYPEISLSTQIVCFNKLTLNCSGVCEEYDDYIAVCNYS